MTREETQEASESSSVDSNACSWSTGRGKGSQPGSIPWGREDSRTACENQYTVAIM